ncbi:hypothetical protein FRC12_002355 [Ceratobasidium sp. 428]|nr:hypothetical protein FRC12_002355 [Ceratobasidium sp. 428]
MASQQISSKDKRRLRRHLQELSLVPNESARDITVELRVEDIRIHRLAEIKKGQLLDWAELGLPCDVCEDSTIAIRIEEGHTFGPKIKATYHVSQLMDRDEILIGSGSDGFSIRMRFLSKEEADQVYSKAADKARDMTNQPSLLEKAGKAGDAFRALLDLGSMMTKLDPTGSAKVVFSVCTKAWERLEQQEKQDAELNELVKNLARMIPSVKDVQDLADEHLLETVIEMLHLIEDGLLFVYNRKLQGSSKRLWRSMISPNEQEEIQTYTTRFKALSQEFDRRLHVQEARIADIERRMAKLQRLEPAKLAGYDPSRQCATNTRVDIINELIDWTKMVDDGPRFAWVHGLAGLGKSSIATSVCARLDKDSALASSFFCKRDSKELRDPLRVLTTIIHGLALRWQAYRDAVIDVISNDSELPNKHIQPLYSSLVSGPLETLAETTRPTRTLVVVVDALDECGDPDTWKQLLACLHSLSERESWLRVIVTSRPEQDIREFFASSGVGRFLRRNVLDYEALPDIRIFVRERLAEAILSDNWPNDAVEKLSLRANGLFIWARTACQFVLDSDDRLEGVQEVLAGKSDLPDPTAYLDDLYTTAVLASAKRGASCNMTLVMKCLGAVVVTASMPLSISNLALLLNGRISLDVLRRVVTRSLSSVLYVDQKRDEAVRISHQSFMDYITDPSRSGELCVDKELQNTTIAECCFEMMVASLKFNICELETSDAFNNNIPNLDTRVRATIPPPLQYSCLHWSSHVANTQLSSVQKYLRDFLLRPKLLYWIEALSLLGQLGTAPASLLRIVDCCVTVSRAIRLFMMIQYSSGHAVQENMQDCRMAANDAYRFVLSFYDAISASTPHLYVSALAFAPSDSGIAQRMRGYFPNLLCVTEGGTKDWTPCLRTISGAFLCNSVAFSPDSRRIVSGCEDRTVRIWDTETGDAALEPLTGCLASVDSAAFSSDGRWIFSSSAGMTIQVLDAETGEARFDPIQLRLPAGEDNIIHPWLRSVALSPDGSRIVSGSGGGRVLVWSAETGEAVLRPLEGHLNSVCSVAFSPDGRRIVSGSYDKTVRVWDAETGDPVLQPLSGHSDAVRSVAFSPDNRWIVSGAMDKTVRMWDAKTGDLLLQPLTGHSGGVKSLVFSPDCSLIVSGSDDHTVRILDSHTGFLVQTLHGHSGSVTSVAFSPDGRRVASSSDDRTIRIWETVGIHTVEAAKPVHTRHELTEPVTCVAYLPNGRYVVTGSEDGTVRIWDAETGEAVFRPLEGHTAAVECLTVSPDSRRVVSGSSDNTVRVWNARTGEAALEPLRGHTKRVLCVAFSHDCCLIASGSEDRTLWIWKADTGEQALEPLRDHSDDIYAVTFSADSQRVLSYASGEAVHIWDVKTGATMITPLEGYSRTITPREYHPTCLSKSAFSADSLRIVLVLDVSMHIWDTETGRLILHSSWGWGSALNSVALSLDGRWIASTPYPGSEVRIWSAETGELVLEPLRGRVEPVGNPALSVAFSPDSRRLVSGSDYKTVSIWDIQLYTTSSTHTPKYLAETKARILPSYEGDDRILVHSAQLARNTGPYHYRINGWVTSIEGKPLMWLPLELWDMDESLICISPSGVRRQPVIDLTHFVHGSSWRSIVGEQS